MFGPTHSNLVECNEMKVGNSYTITTPIKMETLPTGVGRLLVLVRTWSM